VAIRVAIFSARVFQRAAAALPAPATCGTPVAPLAQRDVTGERLDRAAQLARAGNLRAIRLSEKPPFSEAFLLPG
jgi:hypothetical protein